MRFSTYKKARNYLNDSVLQEFHGFSFQGTRKIHTVHGVRSADYEIWLRPIDTCIYVLGDLLAVLKLEAPLVLIYLKVSEDSYIMIH